MKRTVFALLACLFVLAAPVLGQCEQKACRSQNVAEVWTVEDGECLNVETLGCRLLTIETRPDSASAVLTFSDNAANGETFTIGAAVYTAADAVSTAFDVATEATAALFIANLCAAINDSGTEPTDYGTGTTANEDVTCSASDATTLTVTALVPGSNANDVATETDSMNAAWSDGDMDDTLEDVDDPTCTTSWVDSAAATEHTSFTTTTTGTTADRDVFDVEGAFALVTCEDGDAVVTVVP